MQVLSSRVLLRPKDYERTVRFYRDTLGLHVYREFPGGTVLFLGGGFLEISRQSDAPVTDKVKLWLQVPSVEETRGALQRAGVSIVEAPEHKPWGLIEMTIRDPDGLELVIVEVPEGHRLRAGA